MGFFETLQFWHWLAFGLALLLVDVLVVGASVLMWLGLAALFTGVVAWMLSAFIGWQAELVIFAVASVVSVLLWRRFDKRSASEPVVNLPRGAEYVGRVVLLEEAIVGGHGRVRIDDTLWAVQGEDAPAGTAVRITARQGNSFEVVRQDAAS